MRRGDVGNRITDHGAGHGIDGRLAGRNGKAGFGHHADAFAGAECDTRARLTRANRHKNERAVRHVGIIARILDDARRCCALLQLLNGECESRRLAARQPHRHRFRKLAGQKRGIRSFRSGGGAGSGGPAVAERAGRLLKHRPEHRQIVPYGHRFYAPSEARVP